MKVFLSHSSADNDLARRLALDLRAAKVEVWLDQWEIRVGDQFVQKIEAGLDDVEFVIVLLTPASVASEWVDREWRSKFEREAQTRRIAIVPVRGEPCEVPDFLAQRSHADIAGGSYPLGLKHLLTSLRYYNGDASMTVREGAIDPSEASESMIPVVAPIALDVGRDLIPLFEPDAQGAIRAFEELAPRMRATIEAELGVPVPGIRVRGNDDDLAPRDVLILIDEIPEVLFEVDPDVVLVDATVATLAAHGLASEPREDPAAGRARASIAPADRAAAEAAGLTTWDAVEYLFLALQTVIRPIASQFLDIDVTRRLVDAVAGEAPDLVARTVPTAVSWFELTDVLRRLVDEAVSIADMRGILEALSEGEPDRHDTVLLAERARHALRGQITSTFARGRAEVAVFQASPEIEALVSGAIQRTPVGAYFALSPESAASILAAVRKSITSVNAPAGVPILVSTADVRPYVRKLVSLEFPWLPVLSRQDLDPRTAIRPVAEIRLDPCASPATPAGPEPPA